jgi:hypothetical protein
MNYEENLAFHKLWCATWLLNNTTVKYEQSEDDDDIHFINVYYNGNTYTFYSEKKDEYYIKFWNFIENIDSSSKNLVDIKTCQ